MGNLRSVEADLHLFQLSNRLNLARHQDAVGVHRDLDLALDQELHDLRNIGMRQRLATVEADAARAQLDELAERLENLIPLHLIGHWSMAVAVSALQVAKP